MFFKIIYDITELNQLLHRDMLGIFYKLYGSEVSPKGYTVNNAMLYWYHNELYKTTSVLSIFHPDMFFDRDSELYNAMLHDIHPAYSSLFYRMVTPPVIFNDKEVDKIVITDTDIILHYSKSKFKKGEFENVRNATYGNNGETPMRRNSVFHQPEKVKGINTSWCIKDNYRFGRGNFL